MDYVIHFALEAVGGLTCSCAVRFCRHRLLTGLCWFVLSALSTVTTVQIVG